MQEAEAREASLGFATPAKWPRWLTFGVAAGATTLLAVRGGTYDIVARQEASIAVWWILAFGFGLGLLPRAGPKPVLLLPLAALLALGAWTLVSLSWTESDEKTVAEACRVVGYLGVLVLVVSVLDRRTWRAAAAGMAAGALLTAGLATASRLGPDLLSPEVGRAFAGDRLSYPFNYWNAVGAWGAMAVTAALAWSVTATHPAVRAAFLAAIPIAGLAIYLSYSRAAVAGLTVGLICVLAFSRRRLLVAAHLVVAGAATGVAILLVRGEPSLTRGVDTSGAGIVLLTLVGCAAVCAAAALITQRLGADESWRVPLRPARIATGIAAACVLVAGAAAGPSLASDAWDSFRGSEVQPTTSTDPAQRLGSLQGGRYQIYATALDSSRANPTLGTGAGTFEFINNRDGRSAEFVRDAHSIYLEPFAELGWPGGLLVVAFLLSVVLVSLKALRRCRRPASHGAGVALVAVLAVFLVQAGVDWMWETTAVTVLAIGGAGALWVRLGKEGPRPILPVAMRVLAAVVCLLMCLLLVPGVVSTSLVRKSQNSVERGDIQTAAAQAGDAVAVAPWAGTPRLQRGLVAEAAKDLGAARANFVQAARREPTNWRVPLLLARVEAGLGRPAAAIRQYRRARTLRPRAAVFQPQSVP